jgi:hypothetical protein
VADGAVLARHLVLHLMHNAGSVIPPFHGPPQINATAPTSFRHVSILYPATPPCDDCQLCAFSSRPYTALCCARTDPLFV